MSSPRLVQHERGFSLLVDGQPFIICGGELGNSTASNVVALNEAWPRLLAMNLNTLLLPAYWELCEPEEGRFDFSLLEAALRGSRRHGLRIVLLWFGSFKNGMSSYGRRRQAGIRVANVHQRSAQRAGQTARFGLGTCRSALKTGPDGRVRVRGLLGKYRISAVHGASRNEVETRLEKGGSEAIVELP